MALDVTTFRARFPELTAAVLSDAHVTLYLNDATCEFSRSRLSSSACADTIYERIVLTLTAHFGQLAIDRGEGERRATAQVSQESVGQVNVSYALTVVRTDQETALLQTTYGQEYLRLVYTYCLGGITV